MNNLDQSHAEMVAALIKPGIEIIEQTTPLHAHLNHMAMLLAGEAGELVDAIKKHTIYGKELDYVNVIEELGDIEFALEAIRTSLTIHRDETLAMNMEKLSKRYPQGKFSNTDAQTRADKAPVQESLGLNEAGPDTMVKCVDCDEKFKHEDAPSHDCGIEVVEPAAFDSMNASEALYGFMGWLTSRDEVTPELSSHHEAGVAAKLVSQFCKENKLTDPRYGWENNLIHPTGECSGRTDKVYGQPPLDLAIEDAATLGTGYIEVNTDGIRKVDNVEVMKSVEEIEAEIGNASEFD